MEDAAFEALTAADFRRRVARQQAAAAADDYGDHRLNPALRDLIVRPDLYDAAVLIGVVDRDTEATVLLTKRTEAMRNHSGQIAFPGGRIDPTDGSPEAAALRETLEEVGIGMAAIEVVGRLPDYVTGSGFRIVPVLGIVSPDYQMTINADEVADAFEVPLGFLMTEANHRRESRMWLDRERFYYAMPYGERFIWGVTAGIIRTLYERLYA